MSPGALIGEDTQTLFNYCRSKWKTIPSGGGYQRRSITLMNICRTLDADQSWLRAQHGRETEQHVDLKRFVRITKKYSHPDNSSPFLRRAVHRTAMVFDDPASGVPGTAIESAVTALCTYVTAWYKGIEKPIRCALSSE